MLALRNLLTNDKLELGPDMVEAGLPKVVQQRMTQVCKPLHQHSPHVMASQPCSALNDKALSWWLDPLAFVLWLP